MHLLLAGALAFVAGVTFGAFGAGGSILLVPILVYVLGLPVTVSLGMALLILVVTAGIAALAHARSGHVNWRMALQWSALGILGSYGGGRVAEFVPEELLLSLFALIVVASAAAMMRKRAPGTRERGLAATTSRTRIALVGLGLGFLTGMLGVGGGFLLVPALVLLCGVDVRTAIGTSLLVICMNSVGGFLGFTAHTSFPFALTATIALFNATGSLAGARIGERLPANRLRPAFAVFLLIVGAAMAVQNAVELLGGGPH